MTSYHLAKIRRHLLETEGYICKACGCEVHDKYGVGRNSPTKAHVDHIVSLAKGGSNDLSNFQILCRRCNLRKGKMRDEEFKALIEAEQEYVKQHQHEIAKKRQQYKEKCSYCNEAVPRVFTNNLCIRCYQKECRRRSYQNEKKRRLSH
ncbi:HNH endonuclease [Bacillus sp. EB600]|uniref:HNH endonuclease n=1 Tax=Bacillus sp. EB600 TaxID=2806345 RepID=UPI00210DD341|nr:HNH endonuclease signature motif containing protein [Bacillus sp. EB600]MCQ6280065.1 HNH endonuclease [Bacillus sp. EB600]